MVGLRHRLIGHAFEQTPGEWRTGKPGAIVHGVTMSWTPPPQVSFKALSSPKLRSLHLVFSCSPQTFSHIYRLKCLC